MDTVTCYCLKCEEQLGRFNNSWNGIGKTYFSPVGTSYLVLGTLGLEAIGEFRAAEPGTRIEKSFLQDLACKKCKTVVGMRCESAPKGNILKRDQLILRLKAMTVLSDKTGLRTAPAVLKTYSLIDSSASKSSRRISGPQAATEENVSQVKQTVNDRVNEIERREFTKFAEWAEDVISTQRRDIDRIDGAVGRIERDMQVFKDFMTDVRKELDINRQPPVSDNRDIINLQQELKEIRQKLERVDQISNRVQSEPFELSREHTQKMDQTVTEVGSLKMELNSMKTRLKYVETTTRQAAQRPDDMQVDTDEVVTAKLAGYSSRKKAAIDLAEDIFEQGERDMAAQLIGRVLGKRKVSELENGVTEPTYSKSLKTKRGGSNPPTNPSSIDQTKYSPVQQMHESSPILDQPVEPQNRRSVGRPRKAPPAIMSSRQRDVDGESGKLDGRSLRRRKPNIEPSHPEKKSRRTMQGPEIIDLDNDEEDISSSTQKAFHPSAGIGRRAVLPSIEKENPEEENKRRRLEAREALAKETLRFV